MKTSRQSRRVALLAATLVAAPTMLIVSSASAADAQTCKASGYFLCLYQLANAGGFRLNSSQTTTDYDYLGNPQVIRQMNDKATSGTNGTERTYAKVWENDHFQKASICLTPGRSYPDFPSNIDNKSSSHKFYSSC